MTTKTSDLVTPGPVERPPREGGVKHPGLGKPIVRVMAPTGPKR
jgi:hypothetical protein